MSWLNDTENYRKRQVAMMAKAFGDNNIQKATDNDVSEESNVKPNVRSHGGKSDMYKMKMLGLRKFNEQDQKEYIGVEDASNSYIANHENGDIIISKTTDGYLVSKFPIDAENEEGEEKDATTLSEAIDVALQYKDDLDNAKAPEQIMYKETEDNDDSEYEDGDDSEKGFDDEINPFERAAWEAEQDELRKAYETLGFDYNNIEKAKHKEGDMHPNGKWVWRESANGGKGDWRVANPGKSVRSLRGGSKNLTLNDKIIDSQSAAAAKAYVRFLNGGNEEMSFNGHFAEALERANGDTNKVLKVFKEHLKKHLMSAGVAPESVDGYYKQFQDDLDKIAIKNYLKKKGIEWNTSKKKVTLKQIFEDVQGLNPSTSTISSLGTFASVQNQQLADNKARELMGYLPKDSLASKIIVSTKGRFTDKQLWVIAYELEKNDKYKDALSDFLEDIERKERLKKESKKKKRQVKVQQQKMMDERQRENDAIAVGDEVEHPKFGEGKVISTTDEFIKVSFNSVGEKILLKKFVKLNKK